HFVAPLILVRPPYAGANALASGIDPRTPSDIFSERHRAESSLLDRIARIIELDRINTPRAQRFGEIDENRARVPLVFQDRLAQQNLIYGERCMQVELNASAVLQHLEANRVFSADELFLRIDPDIQVVGKQIVIRAIWPVFAAKLIEAR